MKNFLAGYQQVPIYGRIFISFALGFLLSPWSWGFFYFIIFCIIIEIIYWGIWHNHIDNLQYIFLSRTAYLLFSFIGWIIGRLIIGDQEPLKLQIRPRRFSQVRKMFI